MIYFIIGFTCLFAGYIIGTFFTSFLMKQKVVNELRKYDEMLTQKGDNENEKEE